MKPELKFGRGVIAWNSINSIEKGMYICDDGERSHPHAVYIPEYPMVSYFNHVEIDPDADPINGDEVECRNDSCGEWSNDSVIYIGRVPTGYIVRTKTGTTIQVKHVRFPQQSKRECIEQIIVDALEQSITVNKADFAKKIMKSLDMENE